jgi:hypothetical protein
MRRSSVLNHPLQLVFPDPRLFLCLWQQKGQCFVQKKLYWRVLSKASIKACTLKLFKAVIYAFLAFQHSLMFVSEARGLP